MATKYVPRTQDAVTDKAADGQESAREAIAAGHETTDVSIKGLMIFGGLLLVFVAGVLVAVAVFFKGFDLLNNKENQQRSRDEPAAASLVMVTPNYQGPLMQVKPEEDLRWMRAHDAMDLDSYGWMDRPAGVVRMPIERAMDIIAKRGLPPVSPGKTLEELQRERAQPQVFGQSLRP